MKEKFEVTEAERAALVRSSHLLIFILCLMSYLDQLLTGRPDMDVLLPVVELSHDRINFLVFKRLPAGFGGGQLQETQTVRTSLWKREFDTCVCCVVPVKVFPAASS